MKRHYYIIINAKYLYQKQKTQNGNEIIKKFFLNGNKIQDIILENNDNSEQKFLFNIEPNYEKIENEKKIIKKDNILSKFYNYIKDINYKDTEILFNKFSNIPIIINSIRPAIQSLNDNRRNIIFNNGYILNLIQIINHNGHYHDELILINLDNKSKVLLSFENYEQISIYPIYKNIFLLEAYHHMYFYELFPRKDNIELICFVQNINFEIFKSFEFNSNYCIFITNKGILIYNWRKNEIKKTINKFDKYSNLICIFINKLFIVGIIQNIHDCVLFMYNLISDELINYTIKNSRKIIYIYDNFFIIWNKNNYYIFKVLFNDLRLVQEISF